ncbi:uncharacterized protein LOC112194548 [Rosa chinensis]|uniref:uncharacterized protein LOC112194548 n=1 Tax=Rosa chinensis TaxID=74649 RepID=UPI000D0943A8|nr:uncharacterized protein LOC112194548 [Rosa chinensis]
MPGDAPENAPKMIITDQDPAMTKAISEALPQTFHRYCSWHILNKFSEKLDAIKYRDSYQDFHSYIWNSCSREEFDSRWIEIIEKSGLSDNKWLESIYETRSSWIPAYVNHFKRELIHQCHSELEEDHINIDEKAKTVMSLDIEDHMAKYILKRWTKAARQRVVIDSDGMEIKDNKALLARRTKLFQHAKYAIDKVMVSDEVTQLFMEALDAFLENIKPLISNESGQSAVGSKVTKTDTIQHVFNKPDQVRAKGCGRRLKEGKKKKKVKVKDSQGRQCHGCGLFGRSHDKRNCPTLHGRPAIDKDGDSSSTSMDEDSCSSSHFA